MPEGSDFGYEGLSDEQLSQEWQRLVKLDQQVDDPFGGIAAVLASHPDDRSGMKDLENRFAAIERIQRKRLEAANEAMARAVNKQMEDQYFRSHQDRAAAAPPEPQVVGTARPPEAGQSGDTVDDGVDTGHYDDGHGFDWRSADRGQADADQASGVADPYRVDIYVRGRRLGRRSLPAPSLC